MPQRKQNQKLEPRVKLGVQITLTGQFVVVRPTTLGLTNIIV